ncbi:YchJ family protein [Microtetraspora malaysiensis]|uniref:YchJ family protein n=1 Tax=Microtetraspora malaysiensis TaxID=161358 RepID=UPI00083178E2|nr:YchJ family metal-binding protein [Microtetraspora malaysiensis]
MSQRRARPTLRPDPASSCPCGTGLPYRDCCGRLHRGEAAATTAEALMRSRFSAFSVGDAGYLLRTWHPSTRPARLDLAEGPRWVRLEILGGTGGSAFHTEGTVRFRAHYEDRGTPGAMEENSRFVRDAGAWTYLGAL